MGTLWRAQGVRTSIVHQYGTVERSVEPRRVPSCQIRVPMETRWNPIWPYQYDQSSCHPWDRVCSLGLRCGLTRCHPIRVPAIT